MPAAMTIPAPTARRTHQAYGMNKIAAISVRAAPVVQRIHAGGASSH